MFHGTSVTEGGVLIDKLINNRLCFSNITGQNVLLIFKTVMILYILLFANPCTTYWTLQILNKCIWMVKSIIKKSHAIYIYIVWFSELSSKEFNACSTPWSNITLKDGSLPCKYLYICLFGISDLFLYSLLNLFVYDDSVI